jgi:hypothetical protein
VDAAEESHNDVDPHAGMNLNNLYENSHSAFLIVTFSTVGGMVGTFFWLLWLLWSIGVFVV